MKRLGGDEVQTPVFGRSQIPFERQTPLSERVRQGGWVQPEGPLFTGGGEGGEELLGTDERPGVLEDGPLHVGEHHLTPRRCARAPAQDRIDGGFGEVVQAGESMNRVRATAEVRAPGHR